MVSLQDEQLEEPFGWMPAVFVLKLWATVDLKETLD